MSSVLEKTKVDITISGRDSLKHIQTISDLIELAAKKEGTGLALRSYEYIKSRLIEEKAILAFIENKLIGFCYIETWEHGKYIANSGLVVNEAYREIGIAKRIKNAAFNRSRTKYPKAKIFGLTTSLSVMKINAGLRYIPVTFSELTKDDLFWEGCKTCNYYDILVRTKRKSCLCTGMLFNPDD